MPDTADVAVQYALLTKLKAFTLSPAIEISYPNVDFPPPAAAPGARWLRANFIPGPIGTIGIGDNSKNEISGILQVDALAFPGDGELHLARLAQLVANHFPRGTILTKDSQTVRINRAPYRGRLLADGPWVFIPVSIQYLAFASNPA